MWWPRFDFCQYSPDRGLVYRVVVPRERALFFLLCLLLLSYFFGCLSRFFKVSVELELQGATINLRQVESNTKISITMKGEKRKQNTMINKLNPLHLKTMKNKSNNRRKTNHNPKVRIILSYSNDNRLNSGNAMGDEGLCGLILAQDDSDICAAKIDVQILMVLHFLFRSFFGLLSLVMMVCIPTSSARMHGSWTKFTSYPRWQACRCARWGRISPP